MKAKSFSGGYKFKGFEGQAKEELLSGGVPSRVIIPLAQGFGSPLEPLVKAGDQVCAGQLIAADENKICSPVHSTINGKVITIEKMNYFKREVTMVIIEGASCTNGNGDYQRLEGYSAQWEKLSSSEIEKLLYESGVTSLDREGIPTHFKSSIIAPEEVEDLIIHGAGSEPYKLSLAVLLSGKNLYNFVEGIKILKKVMPKARVHLAFNKEKKEILEKIEKLTIGLKNFNLCPVVPKYPQGYDEVLVPTLLGKRFPYGYSAANIGIVALNIQAVLHAYEAVTEGKPLIERIIALCGPSFKEGTHLKVRVGTPLKSVLEGRLKDESSRIVLNSLLAGVELNDLSLPVDRTFSQLIAIPEDKERKLFAFLQPGTRTDSYSRSFLSVISKKEKLPTTNLHGEERPCIQCGYCLEVCPVRIMPVLIYRYAKLGIDETLMNYGIFNCIDCNLCSYVCPSKIPLAKNLKDAKSKLIETGCDRSLCILPKFDLKGLEEYQGVKTIR